MSKELEALYRMQTPQFDEEYFLLKSALERKEKLEKAWEICKNKRIAVAYWFITGCEMDLEKINENVYKKLIHEDCEELADLHIEELTETEFNLLKEMLEEK